jgi:hypothetical protein
MKKTIFTLAALSMLSTNLIAELEPIKVEAGKFTLEPSLYASVQYDDNVFLDKYNEQDDIIYRIRPELALFYGNQDGNYLTMAAAFEWKLYDELTDQNDENWYFDAGLYWIFPKSTFFLKGDYTTDTSGDLEQGDLTRETRINVLSEFERTVSSKTSASALFSVRSKDYPNNDTLIGYIDWNPALRFYYNMFPKSDIFGELGYGYVDRSGNKGYDSQYTSYSIGVRREQTAKLNLEAKVGGQYRTNEDDALQDTWNLIFYLKALANLSRLTTVTIHGGQYVAPAANNITADKTELWIEGLIVKQVSGSNLYFDLSAKYRYLSWDDLMIKDVYRKDDEYTFRIGANYKITSEFNTGVKYEYRTDTSNIDTYDFDENKVTLFLRYSM